MYLNRTPAPANSGISSRDIFRRFAAVFLICAVLVELTASLNLAAPAGGWRSSTGPLNALSEAPMMLYAGSLSPWPAALGADTGPWLMVSMFILLVAVLAAFFMLQRQRGRSREDARRLVKLNASRAELLEANSRLETALAQRSGQLGDSEQLLHGALDALAARIAVLDDKGMILVANRSWGSFAQGNVQLFEQAGEGDNYLEACDRSGPRGIKIATLVREVMQGTHAEAVFEYSLGAAKQQRWFQCTIARCNEGAPVRVVMAHRTITLRKKAETAFRRLSNEMEQRVLARTRELQQAQQGALQASEAKSQFLATMSHEIRTPLNGVIGMVDVLEQTALDAKQKDMLDLIRMSGLSLLDIIEDILDFSKIEAGHLELNPEPFSIVAVVEQCCSMLDNQASNMGIELRLFTDPALPDVAIGDELRIRQILLNLASNAIKFTSEQEGGRVSVRALLDDQAESPWLLLQVTDNGIGMDAEAQESLFTAFKQADATTRRRFGGTGLGLAISHHLVSMMSGDIQVRSEPGQGSSFAVRLPLAPEAPGEAPSPSPIDGLRCLVVGSANSLADDLYVYLRHENTEVARVTDLAAAQEWQLHAGAGLCVWVVDIERQSREIEGFELKARLLPGQEVRFVLIERGQRRQPRLASAGRVEVDGNVLTRRMLLAAVTFASGRKTLAALRPVTSAETPGKRIAPSRAEALWRGCLILVAEDNRVNQKVLQHQLGLLGYTADVAQDGREALELWRSGDYALLLTDLHMPKMDGYQLTAQIRAEQRGDARVPILALTANALKGEAQRCLAAGMDDFLSKPARLELLGAKLEKWMPSGAGAQEPGHTAPAVATPQAPDTKAGVVTSVSLDTSVPAAFVGGDLTIMHELLQDFRDYGREKAEELLKAYECEDVQAVGELAHKLKSSAGSVGAMRLSEFCGWLESAARDDDRGTMAKLIPLFRAEVFAVDQAIAAL
ncbi:hybrid sensor histidine kinase/response regulator [Marinobacterium rhizophilum]|uniref:histidine kinase n=1 Tax=Marinobacterium rhizophilum TaxID=420402 RepID=A0ABY5HE16_9GAMM|nr:ATP-binding protein [Marinobacterium rhizophilum]UTW10072.1 response regulator [Marinobacterium rhizophilum]